MRNTGNARPMTRLAVIGVGATGVAAGVPQAVSAAEGLEYSYLRLDLIGRDVDGFEDTVSDTTERYDDGGGAALEGSFAFTDNFFVFGAYSETESDVMVRTEDVFLPADTDITRFDVGVGANAELTERMDFVGRVAYADIDFGEFELGTTSDFDTIDEDSSDGFAVDAGIRSQVLDNLEGSIGVRYLTLDSDNSLRDVDNTSLIGSILFEMSDNWDLGFEVDVGDEIREYMLGVRFSPAG